MIITSKLKMNLQTPGTTPIVHAVQNDCYSRNLEIEAVCGCRPFVFPDTVKAIIRYRKSDGRGGEYDTLPDGTAAWQIRHNLLTVALAPQVLTVPGSVALTITLIENEKQLSIFPVRLSVQPDAHASIAQSEDYFYVTGFLTAPASAKIGQQFRVSAVNEAGQVTGVEAFDPETLSGDLVIQKINEALEEAKESGTFNGQDGHTPERGTDYWTEDDITQIHDYISNAVTDTYGRGAAISSGADLNTFTSIGKYFASSNSLAASLENCPTNQNFMMYVFIRGNSSSSQMIIDLAGKLYIRSKSTSSWGKWVTYITKADLEETVSDAVSQAIENGSLAGTPGYTPVKGVDYWTEAEVSEFLAYIDTAVTDTYRKGTSISSGSNLNDYTTIGKYYAQTNSVTSTLLNSPTTQNFMMFVLERTSGTKTQIIIDLAGRMYLRSRSTSSWNGWITYITRSDLENAVEDALAEAVASGDFAGHTPVKGVDYWTDADRNAMIQDVIAALGTPVFGTVDEENNIILSGALASGTYTLKYEHNDGSLTEIGTLIHNTAASGYHNLADPASTDWLTSYRIKSDLSIVSDDNSTSAKTIVTNYIPVTAGDVVRVKGLNIRIASSNVGTSSNTRSLFCNADRTAIGSVVPNSVSACTENGDLWTYTVAEGVSGFDTAAIAYMRFNGTLYDGYAAEDVVITVNQAID